LQLVAVVDASRTTALTPAWMLGTADLAARVVTAADRPGARPD
jgi:hypothetical protein